MARQPVNDPESNLRALWERADDVDRREGARAYFRYADVMASVAEVTGVPFRTVAGVFAALSPNNDYDGNLRSMGHVLQGWLQGRPQESVRVTTYHHCRARSWAILEGRDPLDVLGGQKTRSFFFNITDPSGPVHVTVDGHMVGVWRGVRLTMDEAGINARQYAEIADGFRRVATDLGVLPSQLQATLWFTQKRVHSVRYAAGQLNLFDPSDHWRIGRPVAEIMPRDFQPDSILCLTP